MTEIAQSASLPTGIAERWENGVLVLSPQNHEAKRRVLFVNSYGGEELWSHVKHGRTALHHLWGCAELVRQGYEVALAEPIRHFEYRRALPHDWPLWRFARNWLGREDIIYCGHTLLFWLPLLKRLRLLKCRLVSLTYAREELDFRRDHDGVLALTPAAEKEARAFAPKAKILHIGWGADLDFYPQLPYDGRWLLSCGRTRRDLKTLHAAASETQLPLRLVASSLPKNLTWPPSTITTVVGDNFEAVPYRALVSDHYGYCAASLIILQEDTHNRHAVGFTNLIESIAMGRPVIMTHTGGLATEIDVEAAGCGLRIPPGDRAALAQAMRTLLANPKSAKHMGMRGRSLCESHYNLGRFSSDLFRFLENL
jgi:glycosyltransferase involved in cell wall biosynthesis